MFNSKTIKTAWTIRKQTAKELNCKVSEVIWSICLEMAEVYYVTIESTVVTSGYCEISLTRSNGITETVVNPKVTRLSDAVFARLKAGNAKAGNTLHSYNNVETVFSTLEIAKPMSNGDILDEMDAIMKKAHRTSVMTREMSKRLKTLKKVVR